MYIYILKYTNKPVSIKLINEKRKYKNCCICVFISISFDKKASSGFNINKIQQQTFVVFYLC